MGRDFLGDNLPPDEINIIEENKNYGWPFCYGKNIHDSVFDKNTYIQNPCSSKISSFVDLPSHSAPLGLAFVPKTWPKEFKGSLLVAFHGSWNRSEPTGYKISELQFSETGQFLQMKDFAFGWLSKDGKESLGRPVDLLFNEKGDLFVSDDKAGVVYKISYLKD
jgi:glucose/arabinose dehydrogenase